MKLSDAALREAGRQALRDPLNPFGVMVGAVVGTIIGRLERKRMALAVDGHVWVEDQLRQPGIDHLVVGSEHPRGDEPPMILTGDPVVARCGQEMWADRIKESQENARAALTGGGFDADERPDCGNVACKACLDAIFQQVPIPNGSERPNAKTKR